jgi:hypothetical protein
MFRRSQVLKPIGLSLLLTAASPVLADDLGEQDPADACAMEADFVFPSITVTPWSDVVVGAKSEFTVEEKDGLVAVTHVGDAKVVRIPSLVAISKTLELTLTNPETRYCLVSSVATLGGAIKIVGNSEHISAISIVGNVER